MTDFLWDIYYKHDSLDEPITACLTIEPFINFHIEKVGNEWKLIETDENFDSLLKAQMRAEQIINKFILDINWKRNLEPEDK